MKRFTCLLLLLAFLLTGYINAQTGIHFGLKAGYNVATQYGLSDPANNYTVDPKSRSTFVGGVFLYYPITDSVGIQAEYLYATKGSTQDVMITDPVPVHSLSKYKINYFEMPILLRYTFVKIKNVGIFGSAGIALSVLLNGHYDITSTVNMGGPPIVLHESGDTKGLDKFDYSFIYGVGVNFKLFQKEFFIEARQTFGFVTLQMPNVTGAPPVPLRNINYTFTIGTFLF